MSGGDGVKLPAWTYVAADFADFSECGDPEQESFDLWTQEHFTLSIAAIDVWLTKRMEAGKDCSASLRRRAALFAAYKADDPAAGDVYMENLWHVWTKGRAVPTLKTGIDVRTPHQESNRKREADAKARHADWQARAAAKWAEPQHANKGKSEIARLIERPGENWKTIRRSINKPE